MTSGADLFVVCKQCGSEVSPYITECPYCGHRLRRRAPKLPPANAPDRAPRLRAARALAARSLASPAPARRSRTHRRPPRPEPLGGRAPVRDDRAGGGELRGLGGGARRTGPVPADGDHRSPARRLVEAVHATSSPTWTACTRSWRSSTVAIFGWLLERRHGPAVVLALFFGAGATGRAGGERGLSVPDRQRRQRGGAGAAGGVGGPRPGVGRARAPTTRATCSAPRRVAALLLAMPFARPEASWLAGVTGGALGLVVGLGMHRLGEPES